MYLFRIFYSFLPLRNPIGFGAADFVVLGAVLLLAGSIALKAIALPYARRLAPNTAACMTMLFLTAILLRLALLPSHPAPVPSGADDFSYVLSADTLSNFRFANPPHPLHQFFEAVFVLQQPTYASIYPLGQGLVMAFGYLPLHSFWTGVLLSEGLFCALCYWMLRGWVKPIWALAGGVLAIFQFGPLSAWSNSYWGGYVSGIAGCLVFGALPRLWDSPRKRYGAILGLGIGVQLLSRPYETIFLVLAAAVYILWRCRRNLSLKPMVVACLAPLFAIGLTLVQDKAITHSWSTLPYLLSRDQYGVPTTFTFQANPVPHVPLTSEQELDYRAQAAIHGPGTDTLSSYAGRLLYRVRYLRFFLVPPLYLSILLALPGFRSRRYFWVAATLLLFAAGTNFYPYVFPHYVAATASLFLLLSVVSLKQLSERIRTTLWSLCSLAFLFWFGLYLAGDDRLLNVAEYQSWNFVNPPDPQGRASIAATLLHKPGQQLVFVRYSASHQFQEWVHNGADIDAQQTVWANDLGAEDNEKLIQYYSKRTAWLLEPDSHPPTLLPYPKNAGVFLTVP